MHMSGCSKMQSLVSYAPAWMCPQPDRQQDRKAEWADAKVKTVLQFSRNTGRTTWIAVTLLLLVGPACRTETQMKQIDPAPRVAPIELALEGIINQWNYPALKIHIKRNGRKAGHLLVRMPEAIDARDKGSGRAMKFYQDTRDPAWRAKLECEPLDLPVTWTGTDKDLRHTIALDNGMVLRSRARVLPSTVRISYQLANNTAYDLQDVVIWSCIQLRPAPHLRDPLLRRTAVAVGGKFRLMRDLIPGFEPYGDRDADRQRFTAYAAGVPRPKQNPQVLPHPGFKDDPDKTISFWHVPQAVDVEVIATVARDGTWSVATYGAGASRVWTNPVISCQHADQVIPTCPTGKAVTSRIDICFVEGGLEELSASLLTRGAIDSCP